MYIGLPSKMWGTKVDALEDYRQRTQILQGTLLSNTCAGPRNDKGTSPANPQVCFPVRELSSRPVAPPKRNPYAGYGCDMLRLDYLSCLLTILSTVLVGKKIWQGWVIAGGNSLIICFIRVRTAQFGFVPANLVCIGLYANNLSRWRLQRKNDSSANRHE